MVIENANSNVSNNSTPEEADKSKDNENTQMGADTKNVEEAKEDVTKNPGQGEKENPEGESDVIKKEKPSQKPRPYGNRGRGKLNRKKSGKKEVESAEAIKQPIDDAKNASVVQPGDSQPPSESKEGGAEEGKATQAKSKSWGKRRGKGKVKEPAQPSEATERAA